MTEDVLDTEGLYGQHVMTTYKPQLVLTRGRGTKVWDTTGKVYLDFTAGIAVLNVGHSHPHVVEAVQQQATKLFHVSNLYYNENQALLAERLGKLFAGSKSFFCNSGAEANEGLVKLARLWGNPQGRHEVICMQNSFHGRTLAMASATGQDKVKKGFSPMPEGFLHATYNDLESVEALLNDQTSAVLLEAIQAEGGVIPAEAAFLQGLRALCDTHGILLLCDEVQCGMGRTGQWFGFEHAGIAPDAFSLAKALGSGMPIGAVVAGEKLADVFQPGHHATTFGGGPLACASALATLDVIEQEGLVDRAREKGDLLREGLEDFVERFEHVTAVRGKGLMLGLVLDQDAKPLTDRLREMGLLVIPTAGNVVRMLPPLNVKDDELEEALDMLDDALEAMHGGDEHESA